MFIIHIMLWENENINVYYSHNVMGKRKYKAIRKANINSLFHCQRVENYTAICSERALNPHVPFIWYS